MPGRHRRHNRSPHSETTSWDRRHGRSCPPVLLGRLGARMHIVLVLACVLGGGSLRIGPSGVASLRRLIGQLLHRMSRPHMTPERTRQHEHGKSSSAHRPFPLMRAGRSLASNTSKSACKPEESGHEPAGPAARAVSSAHPAGDRTRAACRPWRFDRGPARDGRWPALFEVVDLDNLRVPHVGPPRRQVLRGRKCRSRAQPGR